ncbi:hypothetical protein [Devosia sp. SL43]|uniref:hypothetical protein n=1 Tax=Devosia sp. SL43 TaxID=2806348 RepID=UPI001F24AC59|nr:hypothetical protein [Devosia sp. SL43]UJW85220.1 hypothetical protein IM737_17745 [Devosia sp. SL43]
MDDALNYGDDERLHFCVGAYQGFRNFIELAPDERAFVERPFEEKERVLEAITVDLERTAGTSIMPPALVAGMSAAHLYCAVLCWKEMKLAAKIVEELSPFIADGKIEMESP